MPPEAIEVVHALRTQWRSRLGAMLQEAISHAVLFAVILASGLGFGGALLLLVADLLLVIVFSIPIHREYSAARYFWGMVLTVGLLAFLVAMCLLAWGIVLLGPRFELDFATVAMLVPFRLETLGWMIACSALHLLAMLVYAWAQPSPRRAWDRMTVIASGGTFLSLFLLAFVIAFLGEAAMAVAGWFHPGIGIDAVMTALMIGLRLGLACLLLLMPESMWEAGRRPRRA